MWLYNAAIALAGFGIRLAAPFNRKARLWSNGRRGIFERLYGAIPAEEKIAWVHCASLGEFEQGRPLIEEIRRIHPEYKILLTFYSPSGYEIRKNYAGADYIFYLPDDTPRGARRFLEAVHPDVAVFVKYEFWLNYLKQLKASGCSTYIVSAIFRHESAFFKWYGGIFRRALGTFERIFVQDEASLALLAGIGVGNVTVAGDTRFDRVASIAASARTIGEVEAFAAGNRIFVAGSTWPADEELLAGLIAKHEELKWIVVPHEIESERIDRFIERLPCPAVRYTQCEKCPDLSAMRVMVVDTIGLLSSLYRYASFAYIGGGFGVGIHNTLEAATFGLPIAFGPNYRRFKEACDLIDLKSARSISGLAGLDSWLSELENDTQLYERACKDSAEYVRNNCGATAKIITRMAFR